VSERIIFNSTAQPNTTTYFWRTYDGAEIDLVEEFNGDLYVFEFKMKQKRKLKIPYSFVKKYDPKDSKIISPSNLQELLE